MLALAEVRVMASPTRKPHPTTSGRREFTATELAREAESTVRNIRAYQERGLLPAPERRGRAAVYTDAHLARLRMIGGLLARGYTIANIREMCAAWERGHDIGQLLGLESALTEPFSNEAPAYHTVEELLAMFEGRLSLDAVARAVALELAVPEAGRFKVPSPRLLQVGIELAQAGIPVDDMIDVLVLVRANVDQAAREIVARVARWAFDEPYGDSFPPPEDAERLASLIWRLRPLVDTAVSVEAARAMRIALDEILGERLHRLFRNLRDDEWTVSGEVPRSAFAPDDDDEPR